MIRSLYRYPSLQLSAKPVGMRLLTVLLCWLPSLSISVRCVPDSPKIQSVSFILATAMYVAYLPQTTGTRLTETFGAVSYIDRGVNGATCLTFTHPDRIAEIAALKPELLILSFGTNESHNRRYNINVHYNQMDELVKLLRDSLPNVPILLTTPPGSMKVSGSEGVDARMPSIHVQRQQRKPFVVMQKTIVCSCGICTM